MHGRPAWYKKLKQQTFENNSDRFWTNLDPFVGVFRLPSGNNNESWHKTDCCNAVRLLVRGTERHQAAVSGGGRHRRCSVDWASDSYRSSLLLTDPTCFCIFQTKNKQKNNFFFLVSFTNNFFSQFPRPITFEIFKPNLQVLTDCRQPCHQNNKDRLKKNWLMKRGLRN